MPDAGCRFDWYLASSHFLVKIGVILWLMNKRAKQILYIKTKGGGIGNGKGKDRNIWLESITRRWVQ